MDFTSVKRIRSVVDCFTWYRYWFREKFACHEVCFSLFFISIYNTIYLKQMQVSTVLLYLVIVGFNLWRWEIWIELGPGWLWFSAVWRKINFLCILECCVSFPILLHPWIPGSMILPKKRSVRHGWLQPYSDGTRFLTAAPVLLTASNSCKMPGRIVRVCVCKAVIVTNQRSPRWPRHVLDELQQGLSS